MNDFFHSDSDDLPLFSRVNSRCTIERSDRPDALSYSAKVADVLRAFEFERDITCFDVEKRWHRGQAVIGELRGRGHIIDTIDGHYVYRGYSGEMVRGKDIQQLYYATEHWRETAKKRKEFDGFACVQCKSTDELETHHWRYELFAEDLRDLVTLCRRCHEAIHERIKGSGVHFPKYVSQATAEKIRGTTAMDEVR